MEAPGCGAICHALATSWALRTWTWGRWLGDSLHMELIPATVKALMGLVYAATRSSCGPLRLAATGCPLSGQQLKWLMAAAQVVVSPRAPAGDEMLAHARSPQGCLQGSSAFGGATRGMPMQSYRNATDVMASDAPLHLLATGAIAFCGVESVPGSIPTRWGREGDSRSRLTASFTA